MVSPYLPTFLFPPYLPVVCWALPPPATMVRSLLCDALKELYLHLSSMTAPWNLLISYTAKVRILFCGATTHRKGVKGQILLSKIAAPKLYVKLFLDLKNKKPYQVTGSAWEEQLMYTQMERHFQKGNLRVWYIFRSYPKIALFLNSCFTNCTVQFAANLVDLSCISFQG